MERKREGEKHQHVVASHIPATGDLAHNPGMFCDWELNQRPSGLQSGAQSSEPHQPGRFLLHLKLKDLYFKNLLLLISRFALYRLINNNL